MKTRPVGLSAIRTADRIGGLRHMVGNSPLLRIACLDRGRPRTVYAKAENLNMTGSIKDRMALHILRQGHERGLLEPGPGSSRPRAAIPASRSPGSAASWATR